MRKLIQVFEDNATFALLPILVTGALLLASCALVLETAEARYERDIHRIGFNNNWDLLDAVRREAGLLDDSLALARGTGGEPADARPYLVVSIEDRRRWYKRGDSTLFTTEVAVGSGKSLVEHGGREEWKFDTPRGRLVVKSKEEEPVWVPPDWHFVEFARKRGLGVVKMVRGKDIPAADGSVITVRGSDVARRLRDGRVVAFPPPEEGEGREIVIGGNVIIPPFGTNQRRYKKVLGTHRLNLGDGYALHGTNKPETVGQAVSHGCIRLRNEDIAHLYGIVEVGTPVYIY
jgi:lipoprotein-anchoring transpeptidase ErfK/SrfK